eukprot:6174618-Pleurochrysis_carterae.AAC.1
MDGIARKHSVSIANVAQASVRLCTAGLQPYLEPSPLPSLCNLNHAGTRGSAFASVNASRCVARLSTASPSVSLLARIG